MSPTIYQSPLKTKANTAAAKPNGTIGTAVATAGLSAVSVSFRWYQPNLPPTQNDNSAGCFCKSACQFGENNAKFAAIAVFRALFAKCCGCALMLV